MMAMCGLPTVKRGDAYRLRVPLELNGEAIAAEDLPFLHCVEFMLGEEIRKLWPEDAAFADGAFLIPVSQEETFSLEAGDRVDFDVRVHFVGGEVVGLKQKGKIRVVNAISEVKL